MTKNNSGIKYLENVKGLSDVQYLKDVQPLLDVQGLQDVVPLSVTPTRLRSNLNQPYTYTPKRIKEEPEKANSLLDVLLGSEQRDVLLKEQNLDWAIDIPVLNHIVGTYALLEDKYIDPVKEAFNGDKTFSNAFKEIGLNTLTEVSEDLDVFSNIIKSQFYAAGGAPGLNTLADSLGLNGKRVTYNFNTGNTLEDIIFEVVSDPVNWFTLGASAGKNIASKEIQNTVKVTGKEALENVSKKSLKDLSKRITEEIYEQGVKANADNIIAKLSTKTTQEISKESLKEILPEIIETTSKSDAYRYYTSALKLKTGAKAVDDTINRIAWMATPVYLPWQYLKEPLKEMAKHLYENFKMKVNGKFDVAALFKANKGEYEDALKSLYYTNKDLSQTVFKNNKDFFYKLGFDEVQLQDYAYKFLKTNGDTKTFTKDFIEYLYSKNETFKTLLDTDTIFKEYIESEAFDELLQHSSIAPLVRIRIESELMNSAKVANINTIKKTVNKSKKDLQKLYEYINNNVLVANGKQFGLDNIDGFIAELMISKNVPMTYKQEVAALLESLGINRSNAKQISSILKSNNIKDKNKAITKILENTIKEPLISAEEYNKMLTKTVNRINEDVGSTLNKIWKDDIAKYGRVQYADAINNAFDDISQAVTSINNNSDVQHAVNYIQRVIRLQDLPEFESLYKAIDNIRITNSTSELTKKELKSLKSFFKDTERILSTLDTDTSVAFDIPKWFNNLTDIEKDLKSINDKLLKVGAYGVEPRRYLNQLLNTIDAFKNRQFIDDVVNYVSNINGMVQTQLSHLGMFNVLVQHTHLSNNPEVKIFLEQLTNKNSIYRTTIVPNLIKAFEEANMPEQALNIKRVIAQIDTVKNLNELLNTELPLSFKISNKTQKDLNTIVFDVIDNNKSFSIADIQSEELVKKYSMSSMNPDNKGVDYFKTYRDSLNDEIKAKLNTKQIQEAINKDIAELGLAYSDVKEEILNQLNDLLDNYISKQSLIDLDNISLSTLYSLDTTSMLDLTSKIRYDLLRNKNITKETISYYDTFAIELQKFGESIGMGVDEIKKINKELETPIAASKATEMLQKISESYNLYSGSVESTMYAGKYIVPKNFETTFKLTQNTFSGSIQEYQMLADRLWTYHDILHEEYKYEKKYLDKLKSCLINTYSKPNTLFAPKDAAIYFNQLDAQELLTWDCVSRGNLSLKNKTTYYNYMTKYNLEEASNKISKSTFAADVEALTRNKGFTNSDAIGEVSATSAAIGAMDIWDRTVAPDLMYTLHSLDDLNSAAADITKFNKDDVAALHDIVDTVTEIKNDTKIRESYGIFGNPEDTKLLGGSEYGYRDVLYNGDTAVYEQRCAGKALSIANMDAEELATHIYRQTPGAMVFHNEGIVKVLNADGTITWKGIDNIFEFSEEELKNAGLKIKKYTDENGEWFIIRLTDDKVHNKIPKYNALPNTHKRIQERYSKLFEKYRYKLNLYNPEDIPSNLLTAETINSDTWTNFVHENLDFFGDLEEQKLYQKLDKRGISNFFNKSFERGNFTIIGGKDTYNIWNNSFSDSFIQHSTEMSRNTISGLTSLTHRSNKITKYLSMFYTKDFSLDNPLLVKMFSEADNKKIHKFFSEGNYTVALLRKDKYGLPKVMEYTVTNRRTLDKAIAEGGILVTRETYTALRQVVNNRQMTNNLLDIYRRIVPSTYKSLYLYTAGFPFRNFFDTLIWKNTNELGLENFGEVVKYDYNAYKALQLHDMIQKEVLELGGNETFNKENLLKVLNNYSKEEADTYFLVDLFIESPASGGLSNSLGNWLEEYNKKNTLDIRYAWEKWYEDEVLFGKQKLNPLYRLREMNDMIEQSGRLGLFLASVDKGMSVPDAIKRVVKTHFDYNGGSDLLQLCEKIFWFSTFPINNLNYYLAGGLTKSPSLIKLMMDVQTASWNNGEYTYEELKKTNFLSYHALAGNIRIGNKIIKLSPSLFDFISITTDPIGNIKDRLNPIISLPMTKDLSELNPAQTQFRQWPQQWKIFTGEKGFNPLPSIISNINKYDWDRTLYRWRGKSGIKNYAGTWTKYPKIKKPKYARMYARKYYARRYSTNVRKFTRISMYKDRVHYYRISRRDPMLYRDY